MSKSSKDIIHELEQKERNGTLTDSEIRDVFSKEDVNCKDPELHRFAALHATYGETINEIVTSVLAYRENHLNDADKDRINHNVDEILSIVSKNEHIGEEGLYNISRATQNSQILFNILTNPKANVDTKDMIEDKLVEKGSLSSLSVVINSEETSPELLGKVVRRLEEIAKTEGRDDQDFTEIKYFAEKVKHHPAYENISDTDKAINSYILTARDIDEFKKEKGQETLTKTENGYKLSGSLDSLLNRKKPDRGDKDTKERTDRDDR